jgi:hypothetical protein
MILILLLAVVTGGLAAFALVSIFGHRDETLDNRLGHYGGPSVVAEGEGDGEGDAVTSLFENSLLRRAVGLTSKMAQRGDMLVKVERLLEQANLPLRPAEALFFYGAGVTLVGLIGIMGAPSLSIGLIFAAITAAAGFAWIQKIIKIEV